MTHEQQHQHEQQQTTSDATDFEASLARLSEIVQQLEEGDLTLDESLARYEQGIFHLAKCQKMLAAAEQRIEMLHGLDAEGNPVTHRFDEAEMTLDEKARSRSRRRTANPLGANVPPDAPPDASETQPAPDADDMDLGGTLF